MLKKIIALCILFFFHCIYAETCPTISEIKNNVFRKWQPFNADSGEPITNPKIILHFRKKVNHFTLAEWMPDAPEGPSHCYYDVDSIYLVKTTKAPRVDDPNWHHTSLSNFQCMKKVSLCLFQD